MKVVVQRSRNASVVVNKKIVGRIDNGLMLLVGFCDGDNEEILQYMAGKIVNMRIFPDDDNIMNKSILDIGGQILSVSQFTLYADCKKGNRPSYINAMNGDTAKLLYDQFNKILSGYVRVETGIFGEDMDVELTNCGPTTIILERGV